MPWSALVGAALGAVVFWFASPAMPDDALITLSFARNVVDHGCWCITTGLEVNTATSPLTVWLYALPYAVLGHAFWAAGIVFVACYAAIGWWTERLGGRVASLTGLALLATSPILTAAVGMETLLGVTVLLGAVYATDAGRWRWLALAVGAAPLTRPDLAAGVLVAVLLCAVVAGTWRPALVAAVAGLAATVPWYAFSWWHFGSLWPDTLPVKAGQPGWGASHEIHLWNGLPWALTSSPVPMWLTVLLLVGAIAGGAVALERRLWAPVAVALGGTVEFVALCTSATTPIVYYPGILVGAAALSLALVAARVRWLLVWPAVLLVVGLAFAVHHADDVRGGFTPLRQNWATNAQYAQIVAGLPTDGIVWSPGEIGAFAFYCQDRQPQCTVVDPFLADPGRVGTYVTRFRGEHPRLDVNYANRAVPPPAVPRWRVTFTYPGRPQLPGDVATTGGLWIPGYARVEPDDGS